jgi:hypothetical protein
MSCAYGMTSRPIILPPETSGEFRDLGLGQRRDSERLDETFGPGGSIRPDAVIT